MENWQKTYVKKNLPVLIEITKCSAGLKARLKAKELLTNEEDERLTAIGRNEGSIREAKMLYEFMMGRSRGYTELMEVLRDTRQDGAFKILQDGLLRTKLNGASCDSAEQLMKMRVRLANKTKSFKDVFLSFTLDDARDLLRYPQLKQEFEELLLKGSLEIRLDCELPLTSDLYISRQLSNRLQLDPKVFTLDSCEDAFVFTNISRGELAKLVKPYAVRSSTNQRSLVTARHIYLDHKEDWEDMVALSECPIHLVSKDEDGYVLQRTTTVTDVLQNFVLREGRGKEAFVTEDIFVRELMSDQDSNGALICDVAGMGKTWLMQCLATKLRDNSDNLVVFFIELASIGKYLSGIDHTPPNKEALPIVLDYACPSKLASHLLHKNATKTGPKVVLVFDGFDEISRDDIEVVYSILLNVSKFDRIKMLTSSRPNLQATLQKAFNLIAYDILPFQMDEQVRCITEQWTNVFPATDSDVCNLKKFALQCIKSVKSIQNDDAQDFLGVPLKCRILATVNEKQAKQLCKANRQRPLEVVEAATIKSVFDLYTLFVDCLVNKLAETIPQDARMDFLNGILTFYTHMALELLFPDLSNVYLKHCKIDSFMDEFYRRVGVAFVNNVNQRLEFIHRSFAEYFVGRFFAEFWNDIEQFSPSFVHMVGSYFIRNIMMVVDSELKNWNAIKYKPWYWYNLNVASLLDKEKTFHLKYPLILLFMKMERPTNVFRNAATSFATEAITTTQSLQPLDSNFTNFFQKIVDRLKKTMHFLRKLKILNKTQPLLYQLNKWLAKASFATMIACIDERLTNIFSPYVQMLISFLSPEDRVASLLPNEKKQKSERTAGAVWLLCRVAMSKSPENAVELFNLFGDSEENFLSMLCQNYPQEYWSPLEVAIITKDIDMVLYFVDKVSLPVGRLFIACVAVDKKLAETDVDAKVKMMKMVLGSSDHVMEILCTDNLYSFAEPAVMITKYSFQLLLKFLEDSKDSLSSINNENKRFVLEICLRGCNDEVLLNFLLSLYGKSNDKKLSIGNFGAGPTFTAEVVLDALDLDEVRDAFSKVKLPGLLFSNCLNLETLKVLIAIQPDFSRCNKYKWNYLHVAAATLNIDWVKHLTNSGYEVDQPDRYGETPLLIASSAGASNPNSLLAVTRLLVENRANVYAKDRYGRNLAHRVFEYCWNADSKDLCEWVSYMQENGYYQLWDMRDIWERTPQETLIKEAGENTSITADVLRLLENYSVVSTK